MKNCRTIARMRSKIILSVSFIFSLGFSSLAAAQSLNDDHGTPKNFLRPPANVCPKSPSNPLGMKVVIDCGQFGFPGIIDNGFDCPNDRYLNSNLSYRQLVNSTAPLRCKAIYENGRKSASGGPGTPASPESCPVGAICAPPDSKPTGGNDDTDDSCNDTPSAPGTGGTVCAPDSGEGTGNANGGSVGGTGSNANGGTVGGTGSNGIGGKILPPKAGSGQGNGFRVIGGKIVPPPKSNPSITKEKAIQWLKNQKAKGIGSEKLKPPSQQ